MPNMNKQKIENLLKSHSIILFMKGDIETPKCGFSMQAVETLKKITQDFTIINILDDHDLRQDLKEYSSWPTYPQLYIDKELIGGSDIIKQLYQEGELDKLINIAN